MILMVSMSFGDNFLFYGIPSIEYFFGANISDGLKLYCIIEVGSQDVLHAAPTGIFANTLS